MNIGFNNSPLSLIIIVAACVFLFSLMRRRDPRAQGGSGTFGRLFFAVVFVLMLGGLFFIARSRDSHDGLRVVEPQQWGEALRFDFDDDQFGHGQGHPSSEPQDFGYARVNAETLQLNTSDLFNCRAVLLPADEDGTAWVRVEADIDPSWRMLAVDSTRDPAKVRMFSQLVLAEARNKFSIAGPPQADKHVSIEGPFHFQDRHVVWTTPIKLRRGAKLEDLKIHGSFRAQLLKDGMLLPIDRDFVATLGGADDSALASAATSSRQSQANGSSSQRVTTDTPANGTFSGSSTGAFVGAPPTISSGRPDRPNDNLPPAIAMDPAFQTPESKSLGYEWWERAVPDYTTNGGYFVSVKSDNFHQTQGDKLEADLRKKAVDELNEYMDNILLEPGASERLNLDYEFVDTLLVTNTYMGIGDIEIDPDGAEMRFKAVRLAMTPEVNARIKAMYQESVVDYRIMFIGSIVAMFLACVGVVYGYFRADTATKGYYSLWLKVLAIAACILILAAGSGILEGLGQHHIW